jgi:hypothetical protein
MRKYLMIKNGMLTLVVTSIYYKSVFADVSMFVRIFGTVAIFVSLMWLLKEADRLFMEDIVQKRKRAHRSANRMHSTNEIN